MELGNMFFGNSRGEFPIERGVGWETALYRLFDAYAPDRDKSWREYGVEFENDVFSIFPYYWGRCTCDIDEEDEVWCTENDHEEHCYQIALQKEWDNWLTENPEPSGRAVREVGEILPSGSICIRYEPIYDDVADTRRIWLDRKSIAEKDIYDRLCAQFGVSREFGCAVHCTCSRDERWQQWCEENRHDPKCPIVRPNFLYKPTGFEIQWYKYPLRDSYCNQEITLEEFEEIIDACIRSVEKK